MLFGNRDVFAIETSIIERIDGWVLGVFLFWIRSMSIGNPDDHTDLKGCLGWLRDFVQHPQRRFEPILRNMPPAEVFKMLHGAVMAGSTTEPLIPDAFSRFHIGHIGMSSFDRFDLLLIEDPEGAQRILWREGDAGEPHHAYLPRGELQAVARQCIEWLSAEEVKVDER
jgi:hypothetical protein